MHFIENYILSQTSDHLLLLKYLLILMLLLHLPFISMMIGGSFFSIIFNILAKKKQNQIYLKFAHDLIDTIAVNKSVGLILGILPLIVIILIYAQILYTLNLPTVDFLLYSLILVFLGFVMLYVYKDTFRSRETNYIFHIVHGILGILLIYGAYFIFFSSLNLILDPGEWQFIKNPFQLFFYTNGIIKYLFFIVSSFAITGGCILFFFFDWTEKKIACDSKYNKFVRNFGLFLALTFTLLLPILALLNLTFLPEIALSNEVFICSAILLLFLLGISYFLYTMLKNPEKKLNIHAFGLFVVTFLITIINDQVALGNAIKEQTFLLTYKTDELRKELEIKLTGVSEETAASEKVGEEIFTRICSQCHRFDRKLVGPPLNTVLPKYQNNEDDLQAFIQSPSKKNLGYPPMPRLGLKEEEVASVAEYVLNKMKLESRSP